MIVFDSDDFGADHIISDMCQSHDCRDVLMELKRINPLFKATLFAVPGEMTKELAKWAGNNREWIQLAWHGFYHSSNYECEKMTYDEFDNLMMDFRDYYQLFEEGFKAPGWQISDECYAWLESNDFWVADQAYNDERRPAGLSVYKIGEKSIHTHTWNCVGNGVYELFDQLKEQIKDETDFRFVSEMV